MLSTPLPLRDFYLSKQVESECTEVLGVFESACHTSAVSSLKFIKMVVKQTKKKKLRRIEPSRLMKVRVDRDLNWFSSRK